MKRKLFSILLTMAFVTGLILIPAAPAGAADGSLDITEDYVKSGDTIEITVTDAALDTSGSADIIYARVISGTEGTSSVAAEAVGNTVTTYTTLLSVDPDAGADKNLIEIDDFAFTANDSGVTSITGVSRNADGTVDVTFNQATGDTTLTLAYEAAETAELTENDLTSGVFVGTLTVETADVVGTLRVADGDTITASYHDAVADANRTGDNEATALADTVAPVYDTAKTGDSATGDSSAKNKIYLKFTEAGSGLDSGTIAVTDFEVTVPARTVTGIDSSGADYIILTLDSDLLTDDAPTVKLKSGESVADAVGNTLSGEVSNSSSDGLSPEVVSAVAEDTTGNGYLDKITLTLSETLTSNQPTAAAFVVADSQSNALAEGSVGAGGGATTGGLNFTSAVTTVIVELSNDAGKTGIPTLTYTSGGGTQVEDSANNVLATVTPTVTDSADPTIMDLDIYDTAADGLIDKIIVTFSEYIDTNDSAVPVAADFGTITLPDSQTADLSGASFTDPAGAADTVTITGITGQVTLNTAAGSTGIADDLSSNWVDVNTNTLVTTLDDETVTDSAAPIIMDLDIYDTAADAKIDKIIVTFSENIDTDNSAGPVVADFGTITLPDGSTANLSGASFTDPTGSTDAVTITGITGQVTLNTAAGATDISGDLSANWVDGASNTLVTVLDDETVTDSAIPVIIDREAQLGSAKVTVKFSEGVYAAGDETGALDKDDFGYPDANSTGAGSITSVSHIAGRDIAVLILDVQVIAADTSGTPDTINAASGTIFDVGGLNAADTAVAMVDLRIALSLVDGWNLVSIPKVASSGWNIINNVTGTIEDVYIYDNGGWSIVTDANSLDAVFIKADGPQELTLEWWTIDIQMAPPTKALEAGWNLVGANMDPPTESSVPLDEFLDSVSGSYSTVFSPGYNLLSPWTVVSSGASGKAVFLYEGYWIYMTAAAELAGRTT